VNAVSLLTGVHPYKIDEQSDYTPEWILPKLRRHGVSALKVESSDAATFGIFSQSIHGNHVILASQRVKVDEASWFVIFDNRVYHNFEVSRSDVLDFINFPIIHGPYLLWHKSWGRFE